MNICFSYDHLYPAADRAGRHIETLARRFQARGHQVSVLTTPAANPQEPEGIAMLRLREAPGAKGHSRSDMLLQKAITRFLKQNQTHVLFAEGLTPLSAVAMKAAVRAGAKTIVRVLADAQGVIWGTGADRKLAPSVLKKRIATMLDDADAAAASSVHCADLLKEYYSKEIRVIEKCVDLNVFKYTRVTDRDVAEFRDRFQLGDRPVLIYGRDQMRAETILSTIPLMLKLVRLKSEVVYMIVGQIEQPSRVTAAVNAANLGANYRLTGALGQRDTFTAYCNAELYVAPHDSRASESELLEAMAMRCAVACYGPKVESARTVLLNSNALVLDDDDDAKAAIEIKELLDDEARLQALKEHALETARSKDIGVAVNEVERLCEQLIGLQPGLRVAPRAAEAGGDDDDDIEGGEDADMRRDDADDVVADERKDRNKSRPDFDIEDDFVEEVGGDDGEDTVSEAAVDEDVAPDALIWNEDGSAVDGEAATVDADADAIDSDDGEGGEDGDREDDDGGERRSRRSRRRRGRRRLRHESDEEAREGEGGGAADGDAPIEEAARVAPEVEGPGPQQREEDFLQDAGRRLRELDPRLTLKDLLPFLRPPKDVVIMSLATGSGQHRAGEALFEAFRALDQNLRVRQVNILEFVGRNYSPQEVEQVLEELRQSPAIFGNQFETGATAGVENPEESRAAFFDNVFDQKFKAFILDKRPQQVVLTHFLPLKLLAALKTEHELKMKIAVVITDYDYHPYWFADGVDLYVVPTEKVRFKLVRAGVPAQNVEVVGIPVHPRFDTEVDRDATRRSLGVRGGVPTVLLRPGGIGSTEAILETVDCIVGVGVPLNLLVLCGKNEALVEAIRGRPAQRHANIKAFGFVPNIHEVMGISDLMITRAAGHTIAEAHACGLPMVLLRPVAGVEERTADWFVERGAALKAYDSVDLEWIINDLLRNSGRALKEMRDATQGASRPKAGAAAQTVERLARHLH